MCRCTPEIRTPFCGRFDCKPECQPKWNPAGGFDYEVVKELLIEKAALELKVKRLEKITCDQADSITYLKNKLFYNGIE